MKPIISILLVLLTVQLLQGGPKLPSQLPVTSRAAELFATASRAEAVNHLRANVRAELGADGVTVAVVQGLIDVANTLYNQRKLDVARAASAEAFAAAETILNGRSAARAARRAELLSSLGMLAEHLHYDFKSAEALYDAAIALNPAESSFRERKNGVAQKHQAPGRPGS